LIESNFPKTLLQFPWFKLIYTRLVLAKRKPRKKLLDGNIVILGSSSPDVHYAFCRFAQLRIWEKVKAFFVLTTFCTMISTEVDCALVTTDWAEEAHFTSHVL